MANPTYEVIVCAGGTISICDRVRPAVYCDIVDNRVTGIDWVSHFATLSFDVR